MIDRAIFLHEQICSLLIASYDNLQDHISIMSSYLNEFEQEKTKLGNFAFN
jgi:hypothetical protein